MNLSKNLIFFSCCKSPWKITLGLLLFVFGSLPLLGLAQQANEQNQARTTTTKVQKVKPDYSSLPKNPRKAVLYSAILPGAGQVYNGKAWKAPILYAGIMADVYFIGFNNKRYQTFRSALFAFDDGDRTQFPSLNREALVRNVDYWRQNRDVTILLLLAIYALNLVDANVDAHLSGFDISDNIGLKFTSGSAPLAASNTPQMGLTLKIELK